MPRPHPTPPAARLLAAACALLLAAGLPRGARAQLPSDIDTSSLVGRLHLRLLDGRPLALRDLMTLADHPGHGASARDVLARATLFDGGDPDVRIDVTAAHRQDLLDFFYARRDSLRYSPLLRAYFVRPVERQATRYELVPLDDYQQSDRSMHLRRYIDYVDEAVTYRSVDDLRDLVEKIADLHLLEGQSYLLRLLDAPAGELLATDADAFFHYLDQLMLRPSVEVADALFRARDRGYLRDGSLSRYLSRLCNIPFRASWTLQRHRAHYRQALDSLGGLERVRAFGYDSSLPFARAHFREEVDYYGRVLAAPDAPDYVQHNALLDLARSEHPRALFYLASQLLAAREGHPTVYPAVHYLYVLRKLTNLGIAVPDAAGTLVYQLDVTGDRAAARNFVRYWGAHYEDYGYDEHRGRFVNRYDRSLEAENLERLFRLLNSENDEVALQAYTRLTRADPVEVLQLVNKYADLLRNTNPRVPSLKNGHLEHAAQLTAFCVRNRVAFEPSARLAPKLDSLALALEPRDRVALENRLVARLTVAELTQLEYWALVHQYHLEASYSVGRVLDYVYSRDWDAVLADPATLRLFLKKAVLFARMDGIGVSDDYLRKFDGLDADGRARLAALLTSESDRHVVRALRRLLRQPGAAHGAGAGAHAAEAHATELDNFLEEPEHFAREEARELPAPTLEQLSELLWRLEDPTPKAKFLYRAYLERHLDVARVPDLMSLLIRDESPGEVAELLSRVYHHRWDKAGGPADRQWLAHWQAHSASYRTWGAEFYAEHLARVAVAERVSAGDLNAILKSPHYDPADRPRVLEALSRLKSNRHLFALRLDPPLTWPERVVLSGLKLTHKDLQDLDKLFPGVPPYELVDYVLTEARDFDPEQRGKLFNTLLRKPWVEELLDDERFAARAAEFTEALTWYLEESELLSEYEEQNTALNLARLQFIGKRPAERLRLSLALEVDEAAKLRIQESIVARLSYAELPDALALAPRLADVNGKRPYNFLSRDFGLPIFELHSATAIDTFAARHARLSEAELYAVYLREFGLDLFRYDDDVDGGDDGPARLDYAAVARILRYDIVLPFIGGGGNRRDLYAYGVIRLLELTEGTTLGFHEKLNENQLFYSYSATRRAAAWLEYLDRAGHLDAAAPLAAPSFNAAATSAN